MDELDDITPPPSEFTDTHITNVINISFNLMNYTVKELELIAKNEQISLARHFRKHELIEILNNYFNSSPVDKLRFYTKNKLLQIVKDKNLEVNLILIAKERNLTHYYQILKDELLNYLIENFL